MCVSVESTAGECCLFSVVAVNVSVLLMCLCCDGQQTVLIRSYLLSVGLVNVEYERSSLLKYACSAFMFY